MIVISSKEYLLPMESLLQIQSVMMILQQINDVDEGHSKSMEFSYDNESMKTLQTQEDQPSQHDQSMKPLQDSSTTPSQDKQENSSIPVSYQIWWIMWMDGQFHQLIMIQILNLQGQWRCESLLIPDIDI